MAALTLAKRRDSRGHRGSVASASSSARGNRRCGMRESAHRRDEQSVRYARDGMDCFVVLGHVSVLAQWGRPLPLWNGHELFEGLVLLGPGAGGEEAMGLRPEELRPGRSNPPRRRAEAASAKHRGDGRGRDVDAEVQEFASDPEVAPPGVLPTESKDQVLDRGIERRAAGPAGLTPAPAPRELSVPPDERVGAHQEALPPVAGEQPARRGEERAVGGGEPGPRPSSTKDLQLVAEHGRLQIPLVDATAQEQTKQTAQESIPQRHEHPSVWTSDPAVREPPSRVRGRGVRTTI